MQHRREVSMNVKTCLVSMLCGVAGSAGCDSRPATSAGTGGAGGAGGVHAGGAGGGGTGGAGSGGGGRGGATGAAACALPFDPGPCRAAIPVFAYVDGACVQRVYGGCDGNANRFD